LIIMRYRDIFSTARGGVLVSAKDFQDLPAVTTRAAWL
jgi:hypothetical protein